MPIIGYYSGKWIISKLFLKNIENVVEAFLLKYLFETRKYMYTFCSYQFGINLHYLNEKQISICQTVTSTLVNYQHSNSRSLSGNQMFISVISAEQWLYCLTSYMIFKLDTSLHVYSCHFQLLYVIKKYRMKQRSPPEGYRSLSGLGKKILWLTWKIEFSCTNKNNICLCVRFLNILLSLLKLLLHK